MDPPPPSLAAVLFDLDGVLTPTALVHQAAWKRTFDALLAPLADGMDRTRPFGAEDYLRHVDGKPRAAGVRDFLASRGLALPEGSPSDPPGDGTVWAVGNAKDEAFREVLDRDGVSAYPDAVALLDRLGGRGIPAGVVTSSANARAVIDAAGLAERLPVVVDGLEAARLGLRGKPHPDTFLEAAARLGAEPGRTAVLEDAESGIAAAVAGGFRPVVAVDRRDGDRDWAGADLVVRDLIDLLATPPFL